MRLTPLNLVQSHEYRMHVSNMPQLTDENEELQSCDFHQISHSVSITATCQLYNVFPTQKQVSGSSANI